MDAMYLNLMFINPRPPVGTAVVDPPLQKILDPRLTGCVIVFCGSGFLPGHPQDPYPLVQLTWFTPIFSRPQTTEFALFDDIRQTS